MNWRREKSRFKPSIGRPVYYAIAHLAPEPMSRLRAGVPEELERIARSVWRKMRLAGIQTRLS